MTAADVKMNTQADVERSAVPAARSRGRPRKDSRLEEVLSCAAALFSSRGYAMTTLEDIGTQLGMTRPGIYYYADSKEDLLSKCYTWTGERFFRRLETELGDGTGRELLSRFFLIYSEAVCDDASRCFLSNETHHLSADRQKASAERIHDVNNVVAKLLEEGAADGSLAPCDRKFAIATLFGAFNSLPTLMRPGGLKPKEMGEIILNIVLDGLTPRI